MKAAPPIVQFTLRVLDSLDARDVLQAAVEGFVDLVGARGAAVFDDSGEKLLARGTEEGVEMAFALASPAGGRLRLVLFFDGSEDPAILRQQVLDLVAVVRRAYRHAVQLAATRIDAERDELTGLANRRGMIDWIDGVVQRARCEGRQVAMLVLDVDRFKQINDRYGHPAGDELLVAVAETLRAHLRPSDRAYRWGGDEFVVVLDGVDAQQAVVVAERLRAAFAADRRARGATLTVGVADIASIGDRPASAQALFDAADGGLLAAKQAGRNGCCVAAPAARVA